ncbi:hypothetical protein RJ641_001604 [Dillenia turbinata]|uniref:Probable purine permease n=1 Tax=Dillenia turbinata TaxID=194707 RepID=A0AAN8ZEM7_9MAGN
MEISATVPEGTESLRDQIQRQVPHKCDHQLNIDHITQGGAGEEDEHDIYTNAPAPATKYSSTRKGYLILLGINYGSLFVGSVAATLLLKFYFNHKGSSRWMSTWVQCAGFPFLLPFILLPFYLFGSTRRRPFTRFTPRLLGLSVLIGLMLGINNLLFSWGNSYLPVSTASLLQSSQLAFTLILSVLIVKQKITFTNLNCVILLTLGAVLIGLSSNLDRPEGLTRSKYFVGFFCTLGAGLLFAVYLPVMEKVYREVYCYAMVMEMQLIMEAAATVLATVGMAFDGGFSEVRNESLQEFDLGPTGYWLTIVANVIMWQFCFMGTAGMVFLTTSLTGGVCMTALMAINVLAGVLVYGDNYGGTKAVSTVLCIWAFSSYVYGKHVDSIALNNKIRHNNEISNPDMEMEMSQSGIQAAV